MANPLVDGTSALDPDYHDGGSSLGEHDTYRQMLAGAKADRTPNFNPERKNNIIDARDRFGQKNPLSSAESTAAKNGSPSGTNPSLAEKLPQAASPIKFTGKGKQDPKNPVKLKGFMKGKGPITALGGLLVIIGGAMSIGQSSLPFAFLARGEQEFNTNSIIARSRNTALFKYTLQNDRNATNNPILKHTVYGDSFSIGKKQLSKLRLQGFDIEVDTMNGQNFQMLVDRETGKRMLAPGQKEAWDAAVGAEFSSASPEEIALIRNSATDMNVEMGENTNIGHRFDAGTLTWRQKIANSFNHGVSQVLHRLGLDDRNSFNSKALQDMADKIQAWRSKVDGTYEARKKATIADKMNGTASQGTDASATRRASIIEQDADGNDKPPTIEEFHKAGEYTPTADESKAVRRANMKESFRNFGIQMLISAPSTFCAIMSVGSSISSMVAGYRNLVGLNFSQHTSNLGAQNQYGINDETFNLTFSETMNGLTTPGGNGKSAIDAPYMTSLFGAPLDLNNEFTKAENQETIINEINYNGIKTGTISVTELSLCSAANILSSAVSIGWDILTIVQLAAPTGVTQATGAATAAAKVAVKTVSKTIKRIVGNLIAPIVMAVATQLISQAVVEHAVNALTQDMGYDLVKDDRSDPNAKTILGTVLGKYYKVQFDKISQGNSNSFATSESMTQFVKAKNEYITEIASYERATRSPFDISSEYTFLGSIFYKTIPLYSNFASFTGTISNIFNIVGDSFASILPSTHAISETTTTQGFGDCPMLESIGAVGDAFCNPYMSTDFSTIDEDPADVFLRVAAGNNFEMDSSGFVLDNGNPVIRQDSELMKYITTCTVRDTMLGVVDQTAVQATDAISQVLNGNVTDNNTLNAVIGGAISGLPGTSTIQDANQIRNSLDVFGNTGYATGEECLTGKHPDFERYLNDQEQFETMGIIDKSAGTLALEVWYKEHPLDQSFEGVLARYSGLTKEQVIANLDFIDYYTFVASYDPSDRLPVEKLVLPPITDLIPETEIASHSTKIGDILVTFIYSPVFTPLRDRAVATA
jgi:hypothetical protein